MSDGGTQEDRCPVTQVAAKVVGSPDRQIRPGDDRELMGRGRFAKPNGIESTLPRKASSQKYTARTANRHR
jgi:hypothetical protein